MIERSTAVKCPPIHYQLAGTKKIQQELAKPGAVEQFLEDPEAIKRVKDTFVGQYSLDKVYGKNCIFIKNLKLVTGKSKK